MSNRGFPQEFKNATNLLKGTRFDVYSLNKREFIIHPGAVVILPILSDSEVILIRNERMIINETLWELPAGTLEINEQPIDTAYREIVEETGFQAKFLAPLSEFYTTPGFCNEKIYAFVAKELEYVGQHLDENEKISVEVLSWDKIISMIKEGIIHDGKTMATLLYYHFLHD